MENYIVRIYRRDCADPEQVSGVLESVEQDTRRPFASLKDLNSMLAAGSGVLPTITPVPADADTRPTLAIAK